MLFIEMLQRAITDLFCFGAKSLFVFKAYSQTKRLLQASVTFSKKAWTYKVLCLSAFLKQSKNETKKIKVGSGRIRTQNLRILSYVDLPHDYSEK